MKIRGAIGLKARAWRFFAVAFLSLIVVGVQEAKAATLVVDDDGLATVGNCNAVAPTYPTISMAVAAAMPGDTIRVCPGSYVDSVIVNKSLRILGAQAGNSYAGRTFANANESTVTGIASSVFSVQAPNVTIDGFSVTNPSQGLGIVVRTAGDNALIVNNIIDTIGGVGFTPNTVGIYLEYGPDRVRVVANLIRNIVSNPTAQGILIGDSTSPNPSLNILLLGNRIEDITSTRGAYGIQVNNGSSTTPTATGYTTVAIVCNTISNLNGIGWVHAIGLEGDTPGALVRGNSISNLVAGSANRAAVFVENNPSFATVHINENNFDVTNTAYGIAVVPVPITSTASLDGTRNWWDSPSGPTHPGNIGGTGALVSNNVRYRPWLRSPASVCGDDDDGDDDDDDHDDDGDRDDEDSDDDDDGDRDDEDSDDDNDGDRDDEDSDDDNDGIDDEFDSQSTRQHQRTSVDDLEPGEERAYDMSADFTTLLLTAAVEATGDVDPLDRSLVVEIYDPMGLLIAVSSPTLGRSAVVAVPALLGTYKVKVRNSGPRTIQYQTFRIASTNW